MKPEFLEEEEEMPDTITLELDNGTTMECAVVTTYTAGENEYIVLLPLEGEEAEIGDVYLYRFHLDEDENPILENIESDEEFEIASEAYDAWMDDQEYDELVDAGEIDDPDAGSLN